MRSTAHRSLVSRGRKPTRGTQKMMGRGWDEHLIGRRSTRPARYDGVKTILHLYHGLRKVLEIVVHLPVILVDACIRDKAGQGGQGLVDPLHLALVTVAPRRPGAQTTSRTCHISTGDRRKLATSTNSSRCSHCSSVEFCHRRMIFHHKIPEAGYGDEGRGGEICVIMDPYRTHGRYQCRRCHIALLRADRPQTSRVRPVRTGEVERAEDSHDELGLASSEADPEWVGS